MGNTTHCGSIVEINGRIIHTHYDPPAIPIRAYDWRAVLDSYDGAPDAGPQYEGIGRTEESAIRDLIEQLEGR